MECPLVMYVHYHFVYIIGQSGKTYFTTWGFRVAYPLEGHREGLNSG